MTLSRPYLLALFLLAGPLCGLCGELLAGRIYTVPAKVYVNQPFEIHFDLEVSPGSEIEDLRISEFPNNQELITVGRLENTAKNRTVRNGETLDILQFIAPARCFKPITQSFTPTVRCMLVERRSSGFFSHWQSSPREKRLDPFSLQVLALPDAGRPAHFSGAVGVFRLSGNLSQSDVQPGDIITLTLELKGKGWLDARLALPTPPDSPLFKSYPAKETLREENPLRIQTQQVFIPKNTNALAIAAARFCFFNPTTERYEESAAGPFKLSFTPAHAAAEKDKVRIINTERPTPPVSHVVPIDRVNLTARQLIPLLTGGAGGIAAVFVFFLFYGRSKIWASLLALTVLASGVFAALTLKGRDVQRAHTLGQQTSARFAPAQKAPPLSTLEAGTAVIPIERAGEWVRVDAAGRRGWIPASALTASSTSDQPSR